MNGAQMRDVLGYPLEEAKAALEGEGIGTDGGVETLPRRRVQLSGDLRVVRQREVGTRRVELVVTRERYVEARAQGRQPAGEASRDG